MDSVSDISSADQQPWTDFSVRLFTTTSSKLSKNESSILSADIYEILMAVMCWFMIPFLLFLGIPGNVVSAMVFYRQGLGERINVCLFLLALADLVSVVILLLVFVEDRVRKHISADTWFIAIWLGGFSSAEYVSQFLSAVIACERCFCVVSPLHAKRLLKTSTMTAIVVVCSVVLVAGMFVIATPRHVVDFIFDPSTNITKSFLMVTK
ncbi:putative G-protein coupled receptor F59B2.13 [Pomacea canaliculata]|uniref:putative G-protein coupled receptor F59B2.13 n=1 Tax=Pomacea canaliculata TaxID=400727 RepID=UPI000D73AFAA|nr:putative G-protein coupled receptor F59B2.13 [Pomacea canaliculata]